MRFSLRMTALAALTSLMLFVWLIPQAQAQIPYLPNLQISNFLSNGPDNNQVVAAWVYLNGRRVFQITAPKASLLGRLQDVQRNLEQISQDYFKKPSDALQVEVRKANGLPVIYINNRYLVTITDEDAKQQQSSYSPESWALELSQTLQQDLQQAKQERQPQSLIHQAKIAAIGGFILIFLSSGIRYWQRLLRRRQSISTDTPPSPSHPVTTQLNQQQNRNLKAVQKQLFQLLQVVVWGIGTLFILNLFPYTRFIQVFILTAVQIPLRIGIVVLGTYIITRLSYALIDRLTAALVIGTLLTPESSQRLQLRVSTISGVTKSITTLTYVIIGILVCLSSLDVNIGPLLAGAGLIGVAISLASQSLIKDAINGFLIILEDQYALGDVIAVADKQGLVENLNLRMTQIRDSEGRLITIPNSEIKIVANLSSNWSQADLNIPVTYQTNIEQALELIEAVGVEMSYEPGWQSQILETPKVLGIENFQDASLMIRVLIKTQPLKQWDVAREYRRRLKIAFDRAGIWSALSQEGVG